MSRHGNRPLGVSGGDPYLLDDPRKPVITVHTGPDTLGGVVLPVVEGELAFEGGPDGTQSLISGVDA